MALFSKRNIKHKYSDPLYIYFDAIYDKGVGRFDIDDPVDREYISNVIDIIESFDKGQVIFQWYSCSEELYTLNRKLTDYRAKVDPISYKSPLYWDFWSYVHDILIMTYISNKQNYLDVAVV